MEKLFQIRKFSKANKKFLDIVSYYMAKRDFETVLGVVQNINDFTKDSRMQTRVKNLFIRQSEAQEYFGIAENIVGSMSNMVFSGNVNIRIDHKKAQAMADELYFDGYFIDMIKETYKAAISMADKGIAYLFFNTKQVYNSITEVKIKDEFIDLEVVPSFEVEVEDNTLVRRFYRTILKDEDKQEYVTYKFEYFYYTQPNGITTLMIYGFDEKERRISDNAVMHILGIDKVVESFDFVPYEELNIGEGMLPNILWIENSLAENLYFQDIDLVNSQTQVFIPETMLFQTTGIDALKNVSIDNRYKTRHITKPSIDKPGITIQEGKSAIVEIEKNMALNIIHASLDAKISPISLGYSLIDRLASNTDIGINRERVSIRLRENHISRLKVFIAKSLNKLLWLNGIKTIKVVNIGVLFDPFITPSVESMTNTLAKQVQFGLKSRKLASEQLNKDELSEDEINKEYELIKELGTQIDYNVNQREQGRKAESNVLKSEK